MNHNKSLQTIRPLYLMLATIKYGSISRASKELNLPGPRFSESIKHLEELWQVSLFVRQGRKLIPTERALQLELRYGALLEHLLEQVNEDNEDLKRRLHISVPSDFFEYFKLDSVIKTYQEQYPHSQVKISATDQLLSINQHSIDLAFRILPANNPESTLGARLKLCREVLVINTELNKRTPVLQPLPYVDFSVLNIEQWVKSSLEPNRALDTRAQCNDFYSLRSLILNGTGAGVMLDYQAAPYLESQTLTLLCNDIKRTESYLCAEQPLRKTNPNATVFLEVFKTINEL